MNISIDSDGYTIRPLNEDDLDAYFRLIDDNRARLADFFAGTVARTQTLERTRQFLAEVTLKATEKTYLPFVIVDNVNGNFAGFLDIKNIDWNIPKAELGCFMDEAYAARGIAAKALDQFVTNTFTVYGFAKLFLRTHKDNGPARRIAEKCGFEVEGNIRRDYKTTSGELVDLIYYGKLA